MKSKKNKILRPKTPKPYFLKNQRKSNAVSTTESDNNDNIHNLIFNSLKEEEEINFTESSTILQKNIIQILEKLSESLKDDKKLLYKILKDINTIINLLINEFTSNSQKKFILNNEATNNTIFLTDNIDENNNSKEKTGDNNTKENKTYKFDSSSKIVFLLKIETLNRKIASLNDELKTMKLMFNDSNGKLNKNKNDNRYKYFMKKLNDIKVKTKCDELKYLIYIENQQKKIVELEKQLKIKHHENLPNDVIKSIRCFPNFVQYNFKEDINPKTLPLHEFLLTYENPKKKIRPKSSKNIKCSKSVKTKKQIQLLQTTISIINNSDRRKSKKIHLNNKIKTEPNDNKLKNDSIFSIKDMSNSSFLRNKNNSNIRNALKSDKIYNSELDKNEYKALNSYENNLTENNVQKFIINKNLVKQVKEFRPDTIMTNKKEFFIAHPTLEIAGVSKGKEQAFIGLPKNLLKLNKSGHFKTMMVFPSSLNETMVNLEKLRNNKFRDFENNGD